MGEKILVADDEACVCDTFATFLDEAGYQVVTVDSLPACLEKLEQESFDLLFLDINLGSRNGLDALHTIREKQPGCQIVMITGSPQPKSIIEAKKNGARDYLAKPIRQASLLYVAKNVLSQTNH